MNCVRFHQLLDAVLLEELPEEAVRHGETCEHCQEELSARRALSKLLPACGRQAMPPGFFARQQANILDRVQLEIERQAVAAWHAPAGSLVLLAGVVAAYAFVGLEGCFDGFLGGPSTLSTGTDPLNSVTLVYMALVGLGLYFVSRDVTRTRTQGAGAGG